MSVVLTIRDVPDDVRDLLARDARERGQSLQAFLLSVLRRQARFSRNRQILAEIEAGLQDGGGARSDAPDAAAVLGEARTERDAVSSAEHAEAGRPSA
ncbi:MAG: hypothetical protein HY241_02225 [Actinobacteria bacterium]|nr:hypothetical protein [Actinomycetota bacterium]